MTFTPIAPYGGVEHVLNAIGAFVHPTNGNAYTAVVEKYGGVRQDLAVYCLPPGSTTHRLVHRWIGGADSAAQIAAGGCAIDQAGALVVWASAVPPGQPNVTKTGFQ